MWTATDIPVCVEWAECIPVTETLTERRDRSDWTAMRLFGPGRQHGLFEAGAESHTRL